MTKFDTIATWIVASVAAVPLTIGIANRHNWPTALALLGFVITASWLTIRISRDHLWYKKELSKLEFLEDGWFGEESIAPTDEALDTFVEVAPFFNRREVKIGALPTGGIFIGNVVEGRRCFAVTIDKLGQTSCKIIEG